MKAFTITPDQIETILSYMDGSYRIMHELSISKQELDMELLNHNVEECSGCHVYCESGELLDNDGKIDGHCSNCRRQC